MPQNSPGVETARERRSVAQHAPLVAPTAPLRDEPTVSDHERRATSTSTVAPPLEPAVADARALAEALVRCVVEILAGARDLDQVSRWVTDDVYRSLHRRVVLAARARSAHGIRAGRPAFTMGRLHLSEPTASGALDSVVVVHMRARSRAVALRLEPFGSRWRASAVHVL